MKWAVHRNWANVKILAKPINVGLQVIKLSMGLLWWLPWLLWIHDRGGSRRGICLALRSQTGSWMLFIQGRGGQVKWVLSPQMATLRCFQWSFFNIYIRNILLLSPHVAMWRPLAHLCRGGSRIWKKRGRRWLVGEFLGIFRPVVINSERHERYDRDERYEWAHQSQNYVMKSERHERGSKKQIWKARDTRGTKN